MSFPVSSRSTGNTITAAMWNSDIVDNMNALGDAWDSYTPVIGGTGWALGNGSLLGRKRVVGQTVDFHIAFAFGSTSTAGAGMVSFTVPTARSANWSVFTTYPAAVLDNGSGLYLAAANFEGSSTAISVWTTAANGVRAGWPFTWASTDSIVVHGTYEAA